MARRDLTAPPIARALSVAGVGALALVVVALTALALQHDRSPQPSGAPTAGPVPTFSFRGPGPDASASPSSSATPATGGAEERFLARSAEGMLWRATAGACGAGEPVVERSDDGGTTWVDVTPRSRGIAQVRALSGLSGTEAELIADAADCSPQLLRTYTQGRFWDPYPDLLARATYPSGSAPTVLASPSGEVALPCAAPASVRVGAQQTALVCDGVAHTRVGSGAFAPLPLADVVALDVLGRATALVSAGTDACAGTLALTWVDAAGTASTPECIPDSDPAAPAAIAAFDDEVIVWSGDAVTTIAR
ncbi:MULTISPECIES: hypothetical protein [Microbacterium]|uniref:hypothetical protein n=1 Tax=Microbacterium plantarum TaxID=1816425 RepID=UPI002B46B103|nr:hypothetical protein [Microbacterium plantarum]WRK16872.1 hypothetical protein VC184_13315 [Microbacterium plantarum]